MSEITFTAGPWAADVTNDVNDAQGYLIACVHGGEASVPNSGEDIAEANARLIASSPDLLEELEQQADGCAAIISMLKGQTSAVASTLAGMLRLQENSARAAIQKAVGK